MCAAVYALQNTPYQGRCQAHSVSLVSESGRGVLGTSERPCSSTEVTKRPVWKPRITAIRDWQPNPSPATATV
jgi:hypothetical protein